MSDKNFSLGYLAAITQWAGAESKGATRVVFPCIQGTTAIAAGKGVPMSVTNNEIVAKADALLTEDNPWYLPNAASSYSQALSRYFDYVVIKSGDKASEDRLKGLQQDLETATKDFTALDDAAYEQWEKSKRFTAQTYVQYVATRRPDVSAKQAIMNERRKAIDQALIASGYPGAEKLAKIKENMAAMTNRVSVPGVTMPIAPGVQVLDAADYVDKVTNGQSATVAEPTVVTYAAAYDLDPLYRQTMDDWYRGFKTSPYNISVQVEERSATDETVKQSGHDTQTVTASTGLFGWFKVSYQSRSEWEKSTTTTTSGSLKVTMSCKEKRVFDVRPGQAWNVPGYRTAWPDVRSDVPKELRKLVQPVSMLCVSGLKIRIEFGGEKKTAFDEEYKKAKGAGGSISIFGWVFSADASKSDADKTSTHKGTWDSNSGVLEVEPTAVAGNCTLLAIIGERSATS